MRALAWLLVPLALGLAPVPALAAPRTPTFVLTAPQATGDILPGTTPSLTFARFALGEEVQRYGLELTAGTQVTLTVLEPWGRPPLLAVAFSESGQEDTLPQETPPGRTWIGPLPLERVSRYRLTAAATGPYVVLLQKTAASGWLPYALGVNWTSPPLGSWSWRTAWRAPWRFMAGVVWWAS